jgi:hypothetical protein
MDSGFSGEFEKFSICFPDHPDHFAVRQMLGFVAQELTVRRADPPFPS